MLTYNKNIENNMYVKTLLAFLLATTTLLSHGQSMQKIWISMPDSIAPYLNEQVRANMVEAFGTEEKTDNLVSGQSHIDTLTSDYLKAQISEAATIEIKRLFSAAKSDSVIACVSTFYGPEPESKLAFFDTAWQPTTINAPIIKGAFQRPDTMSTELFEEILITIDPEMLTYSLSPSNTLLKVTYSLPMLTTEEKAKAGLIIRPVEIDLNDFLLKEVK